MTLTLKFDLLLKNFNHCFYLELVAALRVSLYSDNSYFNLLSKMYLSNLFLNLVWLHTILQKYFCIENIYSQGLEIERLSKFSFMEMATLTFPWKVENENNPRPLLLHFVSDT